MRETREGRTREGRRNREEGWAGRGGDNETRRGGPTATRSGHGNVKTKVGFGMTETSLPLRGAFHPCEDPRRDPFSPPGLWTSRLVDRAQLWSHVGTVVEERERQRHGPGTHIGTEMGVSSRCH